MHNFIDTTLVPLFKLRSGGGHTCAIRTAELVASCRCHLHFYIINTFPIIPLKIYKYMNHLYSHKCDVCILNL